MTRLIKDKIPQGWQYGKVEEFAPLQRGFDLPVNQIIQGNYPVVFSNGALKRHSEFKAVAPGVVTGRSGTIGQVHYVTENYWPHNTSLWVTDFKGNLPKFVYYFYKHLDLSRFGAGSGVPTLNRNDVHSHKVSFPSKPEQDRIVAVLETWDRAIEKLKRKIEIKKEVKKGLMQNLLTGKTRLPGFTEKWKTVALGDISDFVNGYTFKSSTYVDDGIYKIITIANVQDGHMFIDKPKLIKELPSNISKDQILNKGDILISMTGNVGRVCVVNQDNCLLNQRVGKIIPRDFNKDLLYLFLHDRRFLMAMIDSAQGGAQGNLSTGDIKNYEIEVPVSEEEQKSISSILTTAEREILGLEDKLRFIQDQKRYLLNNLITGTIRTPETLSTSK